MTPRGNGVGAPSALTSARLDELKVDTTTTREVEQVVKKLIRLEGVQRTEFEELVASLFQFSEHWFYTSESESTLT